MRNVEVKLREHHRWGRFVLVVEATDATICVTSTPLQDGGSWSTLRLDDLTLEEATDLVGKIQQAIGRHTASNDKESDGTG